MAIPQSQLETWSHQGSITQSSQTYNSIKGVLEANNPPYAGKNFRVYVILGDGEINEGIIWEGAQVAPNLGLANLTAFLDLNGFQSGGTTAEVSGIDKVAVADKFRAFGWNTIDIDGHDYGDILSSIAAAKAETKRPTLIVAHTIKGKGVPFMENNNAWHKGVPTKELLAEAIKALEEA